MPDITWSASPWEVRRGARTHNDPDYGDDTSERDTISGQARRRRKMQFRFRAEPVTDIRSKDTGQDRDSIFEARTVINRLRMKVDQSEGEWYNNHRDCRGG